jgi:hypothetical protein
VAEHVKVGNAGKKNQRKRGDFMSFPKSVKRIMWYARKAREYGQTPLGERKERRFTRLMRYKEAMNEELQKIR